MIRLVAAVRWMIAVATLLVGVPLLLAALGGSPVPDGTTPQRTQIWLQDPLDPDQIRTTAWIGAWLVWAAIAVTVLAAIARCARRIRAARLLRYLPAPVQGLTAAMLGASTLTAPLATATVAAATPVLADDTGHAGPTTADQPDHSTGQAPASSLQQAADRPAPTAPATTGSGPGGTAPGVRQPHSNTATSHGDEQPARTHDHAAPAAPARRTAVPAAVAIAATGATIYRADRGDWVWYIADRFLGDPQRYPDIATLNPELAARYGAGFPDHIEPGDTLHLPADARDRGHRAHATGTVSTVAPPAGASTGRGPAPDPSVPGRPQPTLPPPTTTAATNPTPRSAPSTPSTPGPPRSRPAAPAPHGTAPAPISPSSGRPVATSLPRIDVPPAATRHDPESGVDLGDRGWVTAEVAAAVTAAAALAWMHRRRRYRPRPPGPARRNDPDLVPLPRTVAALHQSQHTTAEDDMDTATLQTRDAARVTTATVGMHAGTPLRLADLPACGVGLIGPGAHSAARGLLAAGLSAAGPWTPAVEATIITTVGDLHRILPDREPATLDRLHAADSIDHALDQFERHLLRRARLAHDTADLAAALGADKDQPPPAVLLSTAPTGAHATRLAAILTVGARLGLVAVVLGEWPAGPTWHVNPDGTTTTDGHPGPRLNVLDRTATADILDTLHQARPTIDDLPPAPPPSSASLLPSAARHLPASAPPAVSADTAVAPAAPGPPGGRRLFVTVLGKPAAQVVTGEERSDVRIRRSDGVQILVHLAVNPDGATSDELMALLWPEVRPHHSRGRFHTTISELRHTLAEPVGDDPIVRTDDRYHLDRQVVDVDLWTLNTTIDQAATAVEPAQHAAALRQIIALYTGTIADGHSWLWLAPYRETTRRHIIDAHVALADNEPEPRQALARIQDAIRLDPYNEDLYQHAMRLHARLASPDGVRRTLRTLTERLNELEIRLSPQTRQLAADLIERLGIQERTPHSAA